MESRETFVQVLEAAFPAPRTDAARALGGLFLELYDGIAETSRMCGKALAQIAKATGAPRGVSSEEVVVDDEVVDTTPSRVQQAATSPPPAESVSDEPPLVSPHGTPISKELAAEMVAQGLDPRTGEPLPGAAPATKKSTAQNGGR